MIAHDLDHRKTHKNRIQKNTDVLEGNEQEMVTTTPVVIWPRSCTNIIVALGKWALTN